MKSPIIALLSLWVTSCTIVDSSNPVNGSYEGKAYRPLYESASIAKKVEVKPPTPLKKPGKIYTLEPYIFINEQGLGIHIIDNSDPRNPINLSFISILGNFDMAAKGKYLYADNLDDMVVLDISDPRNPKLSNRLNDVVPIRDFPPFSNIYFECVDRSKGVVTGWELVEMDQPGCYR